MAQCKAEQQTVVQSKTAEFQWVMGIESSCDETAVAILQDGTKLAANLVASQIPIHQIYGGVVPEIASRQHLEVINGLIDQALKDAGIKLEDLDGIVVSQGPGLVGALLVGVSTAKALAYSLNIPLLGVNHMEGHIYANWLAHGPIDFPVLGLIVSGGHTALMLLEGHGQYRLLGQTRDDAAGEAFDKVARAMKLGYPGGPIIDKLAMQGNPAAYELPRAWLADTPWDFSFSGLKTAVLNILNQAQMRDEEIVTEDLAASFQASVVEVLTEKALRAAEQFGVKQILLAGGVAANMGLRQALEDRCRQAGLKLYYPPAALCTDNAAMIVMAGYHRLVQGHRSGWDLNAVPAMKLEDMGKC
jgi:N6-L-threonylcarbamoyladenine synthase